MNELSRMSIMQNTQQFLYANSKPSGSEFYKQFVKNQNKTPKMKHLIPNNLSFVSIDKSDSKLINI
jgi:hypothetical protein